ncbi:MAG TPA: tetratricopeptide repeat protein, partial [Acidobacteria bacterium]|nr:tetratricopeptide repeat protein [Acidobacteriota bacterium]
GGMGMVFLALQEQPLRRRVALKALKFGAWGRDVLTRFENEKQTLARMDHPGVARVYDAGITDRGRPYFVMEHVDGVPLIAYCDQQRLDVRQRLELFIEVCQAVQHAHQKGVIHRDLKPSNVLVTLLDGRPAPKVIDFGIAKAVSQEEQAQTLLTRQGHFVGTPEYMSPEQWEGNSADIDTRSDIYSLGVLLYELMTGALPFDFPQPGSGGLLTMQATMREQDPPRPSTRLASLGERGTTAAGNRRTELRRLVIRLSGDLDWVILKALERDRSRRYQTAAALAEDLRRHLSDEPVSARAPGRLYRFSKFARRNRVAVLAASAVLLALVAGLGAASAGWVRARGERDRARQEARKATAIGDFLVQMLASARPEETRGREVSVREILDRAGEKIDGAFDGPAEVEAVVRLSIGQAYQSLGEYQRAAVHLERAEQLARSSLDAQDPSRLLIETGLGSLELSRGRAAAADRRLRGALGGLTTSRGPRDARVLSVRNLLAVALMEQGRLADAEAEFLQVVPLRQEVLGAEDPETLRATANLARVLLGQGEVSRAARWSEQALASRRVLGDDHPVSIYAMGIRAWYLEAAGEMEAAGELRQQAYDRSREVFGDEHPYTMTAMHFLAAHLGGMGRKDEARALLRQAVERLRRRVGPAHPATLRAMTALADNLPYTDDESGKIYRQVYQTRRRDLGEENPETLDALSDLGVWLWRRAEYARAAEALEQVVQARSRLLGRADGRTLDAMTNLSLVLSGQGRLEQAAALQREVLVGRLAALPASSPTVAAARFNLALSLLDLHQAAEAGELFAQARESYLHTYGPGHRRTLGATCLLGRALLAQEKVEQAERLLDPALTEARASLGPSHIETHRLAAALGACYGKQGRYEEGERLLRQSWQALSESYGSDSERATDVGHLLADLYRAWGRPRAAARWADGRP